MGLFILLSFISCFNIFITYLGGDEFNPTVIAHLKHIFDITAVKKFFLPTITLLIIAIVISSLTFYAYKNTSSILKSRIFSLISPLAALLFAFGAIFLHPFTEEVQTLVKQYRINQAIKLPEEFEQISALTPQIQYTSPKQKDNFIIIYACLLYTSPSPRDS